MTRTPTGRDTPAKATTEGTTTREAAAAPTAAQPTELVWLTPGKLMVDHNIRHALNLDGAFVASIAEVGILEPIVAVRTATGHVRVRHGHRRTVAAVQAGRETVPVFITATTPTTRPPRPPDWSASTPRTSTAPTSPTPRNWT